MNNTDAFYRFEVECSGDDLQTIQYPGFLQTRRVSENILRPVHVPGCMFIKTYGPALEIACLGRFRSVELIPLHTAVLTQ